MTSPSSSKGREWQGEIDSRLELLLLISPDFIASDYCFDREMTQHWSDGSTDFRTPATA